MGRHSSDSDSSSYNRGRHRRSRSKSRSSSASERRSSRRSKQNSSRHHKSSYYKGRRSRSRGSSKYSRSVSRERTKRRSGSRERSRRRSRSREAYKSSRKTKIKRRSSSSSSNQSGSCKSSRKLPMGVKSSSSDGMRDKLLQAIKAAESADSQLKQQGVLPKNVKSRNEIPITTPIQPEMQDILAIEADGFVPKTFKSSKKKGSEAVRNDDITPEMTTKIRESVPVDHNDIFHASFYEDTKAKYDRWIKKLYQIRERARMGEPF